MEHSSNSNNSSSSSNSPARRGRDIVLPGEEYELKQWKIKSGSAVRRGETVALAVLRQNGDATTTQTSSSAAATTTLSNSASDAPFHQHKRPKKRKRAGSNTTSGSSAALPENSSTTTTTSTKEQADNNKVLNRTNNSSSSSSVSAVQEGVVPILAPADGLLRILTVNEKNDQVIGFMEECSHPAIMEGLCAVCGTKVVQQDGNDSSKQHPAASCAAAAATRTTSQSLSSLLKTKQQQQQQVTVSGGITVTVSEQEAQDMARQTSERLFQQRKLSLVLDLDHTLVHATADPRAQAYVTAVAQGDKNDDNAAHVRTLLLPLVENPSTPQEQHYLVKHFVKLRPHVKEFLTKASTLYEVTVYTAGTRLYAQQITMVLCRHMVGSNWDQEDWEKLRYELDIAQHQLQHRQQEQEQQQEQAQADLKEQKDDESEKKPPAASVDQKQQKPKEMNGKQQQQQVKSDTEQKSSETPVVVEPDENGETLDDDKTAENGSKPQTKKRVSFGEPLPSTKTDQETSQELETRIHQLQNQLQEAERLESLAMELRQRLFGSRIVSRTDVTDLGKDVKSLKRIFPCGGTMAAVVDDREDVWAKAASDNAKGVRAGEPPENLLLVRPYHWKPFLGFADVNNPSGKDVVDTSVGENNDDNKEESSTQRQQDTDVQLLWTVDILQRLHQRFYSSDLTEKEQRSMSVPQVLRRMRKEVLSGTRLVMSGLVPLHKQQQQQRQRADGLLNNAATLSSSPRPSVIRHAESLGAKILDKVVVGSKSVPTHVVAARDGTDKIIQARKIRGCKVVKASWLMECVWSVTRRDEGPHQLGPPPPLSSGGGNSKSSKTNDRILLSSSDSSEDDEDFAAELESKMMEGS